MACLACFISRYCPTPSMASRVVALANKCLIHNLRSATALVWAQRLRLSLQKKKGMWPQKEGWVAYGLRYMGQSHPVRRWPTSSASAPKSALKVTLCRCRSIQHAKTHLTWFLTGNFPHSVRTSGYSCHLLRIPRSGPWSTHRRQFMNLRSWSQTDSLSFNLCYL